MADGETHTSASPLSTIRKDVPAGLERLIARCLAIDPADRLQTAAALVEALEDPETLSGSFASAPKLMLHGTRVKRAVIGTLALIGAIVVEVRESTRSCTPAIHRRSPSRP